MCDVSHFRGKKTSPISLVTMGVCMSHSPPLSITIGKFWMQIIISFYPCFVSLLERENVHIQVSCIFLKSLCLCEAGCLEATLSPASGCRQTAERLVFLSAQRVIQVQQCPSVELLWEHETVFMVTATFLSWCMILLSGKSYSNVHLFGFSFLLQVFEIRIELGMLLMIL